MRKTDEDEINPMNQMLKAYGNERFVYLEEYARCGRLTDGDNMRSKTARRLNRDHVVQ